MCTQDSLGMQRRGGLARSTVSLGRESGRSLQALDGRRGQFLQVAAFCRHKCTATALSTWGMSTYPVAALPSRVARMEEADEPLLAVKRGRPPLHQLLVHFREERNRGRAWSRATARAEEPIISPRGLGTRRCARLQPRSRGGPGKHGRQLWVWFGGGRDTRGVQLRRIFILRGRLPIHRCRDRHLILYRRAKWNTGHAVRRHSRITGEPHRTAAAGGVKGPWGLTRRKALTVTLRSPRALADGSLLVAEKPARVVTEGASPIPERRERRDRSAAMVTRSERTHKPSTNAASARWMPRHWRQRSWLSTEDRKRPQPRGHGRNSVFKKTWIGRDICSFRKSALLVEVPRGIAADRDTAVRTVTPTRTASRQMNGFVEINTFIHLAPKQKSDQWMHLSPIYTRVHGEWLRYANSTSQYSLAFSLSQRWLGLPSKSPMSSRHNS